MSEEQDLLNNLSERSGGKLTFEEQFTADKTLTLLVPGGEAHDLIRLLKNDITAPFSLLYDLTAIDERNRKIKQGCTACDFTVVYHLTSLDRNMDIRIKVPLTGEYPTIQTITDLWQMASWYEREVYDMFGIIFSGHPNLRRILMPRSWKGHPLRKEHPSRATEMPPFVLDEHLREIMDNDLRFDPEEEGMKRKSEDIDYMFLNLGPHHPGTHGLLRLILQLDGEDIVDMVPEIGFHHRAAEKMGERQSWHTYIPYTDRVDYLAGVINNMAYVLSVEKLAGIEVPDRAKVIRIMMSELFRISSHLVWLGTYAQDLGQMSPVFYAFNSRERIFDIVQAITGGRMHPSWFRIGGVAHDLPQGWYDLVRNFLDTFPRELQELDKVVIRNRIFRQRTVGIGVFNSKEAIEWGATGPLLRATGVAWDYRKTRPYSGYENFEFDIPIGTNGDCYDRSLVRMAEMIQSMRIIRQCIDNMPEGPYKSKHHLATPPEKKNTMEDIETLITHFLNVTWGPVIPAGEAMIPIEAAKGSNGYYLISDGGTSSYRTRIRTPSFPHIQMMPLISRGYTVSDLLAIIGAHDFVLADVDR